MIDYFTHMLIMVSMHTRWHWLCLCCGYGHYRTTEGSLWHVAIERWSKCCHHFEILSRSL